MKIKKRCAWVSDDLLSIEYHDKEWGVPTFNDKRLFEFIILEGAQAGLSWMTILKKRDNYRQIFDDFNPSKIAKYNAKKVEKILQNPGIIRNRLKVEATITNAKAYLQLLETWDSFSQYIWHFTDGKPIKNKWDNIKKVPAKTIISDKMSKDLKKNGFKFVGSTICYAFMQAVGMVNDHTTDCFRHKEIKSLVL